MFALKKYFGPQTRGALRVILGFGASAVLATGLLAQTAAPSADPPFPDTAQLMTKVAEGQKKIESLVSQYTFTDKATVYALDKNGNVRNQHTDTYYLTPTSYELFSLHVSHDGKPVSEKNLDEQQRKIEKQ